MTSRSSGPTICVLALYVAVIAGCSKTTVKAADETLSLPFRGVGAEVRETGKVVGGIGKAGGDISSKVLLDRNRFALLCEHRDTLAHLGAVKKFIKNRNIDLAGSENRLPRDASDRLAAVGRQLETARIPSALGLGTYRQLDSVRQSLNLIRQHDNSPRYTGFIADC